MTVIEHDCQLCDGTGEVSPYAESTQDPPWRCPDCGGEGKIEVVPADQLAGAVSLSREQALWLVGQIQGDTSATATEVRAQLLSFLTTGGQ